MRTRILFAALVSLIAAALLLVGCGGGTGAQFVTVLDSPPVTLDPLQGTDASSERLRQLMFNSLLRKNEKFEYVGDLASDYKTSDDGKTVTFTLHDGVTFHDGKPLTSADAKYTLDSLLASQKKKAAPFFEAAPAGKSGGSQAYIESVETPDPKTLVIHLRKPWTSLLGNLVSVPVIPQGSADSQKDHPVGSGPFRFVSRDESQQVVDLAAFENYWQGAPAIKNLRVRTILDANTLQAELQSGNVDLSSGASNLSPDSYKFLGQDKNLEAKQFLDEAGFRDPDGDGPQMRFPKPISFKISSGNAAVSQYAGVIQNSLKSIGVPVQIETFETSTLIEQLSNGQFDMTTLRWVGGDRKSTRLNSSHDQISYAVFCLKKKKKKKTS